MKEEMTTNNKITSTTIRMSKELLNTIKTISEADGTSVNSTMIMLMRLGEKLYNGGLIILKEKRK